MKTPTAYSRADIGYLEDEADARHVVSVLPSHQLPLSPIEEADRSRMIRGVVNGLGFALILWQLVAVAVWWIL